MNRTNVLLLVVLAAQLGFLVVDRFFVGEAHRPRVTVVGDRLFPKLSPEAIVELELRRDEGDVKLVRGADGWRVASEGGAPADETLVRTALESLAELAPGPVVSENESKHVDFGVAGREAIEVVARDAAAKEVARFVLGERTSDWRGAYVRFPVDAAEVMLVPGNVRSSFDKGEGKPGAWRDKTILAADPLAVRTIRVVKPDDEPVVVERQLLPSTEAGKEGVLLPTEQDDWKLLEPVVGLMSRYAGNSLAATLADLQADGFHSGTESPADLGLDPPAARVVATLANGAELRLDIGAERDARRFVRIPGGDDVFLVPSYRLFGFLEKGAELKREEAPDGG